MHRSWSHASTTSTGSDSNIVVVVDSPFVLSLVFLNAISLSFWYPCSLMMSFTLSFNRLQRGRKGDRYTNEALWLWLLRMGQ